MHHSPPLQCQHRQGMDPQHNRPIKLNQAATQFMELYPGLNVINSDDDLDERALKKTYPIIGGMLPFFIIMTMTLLYYNALLYAWLDSEALDELSTWGIEIIMTAHDKSSTDIGEICKSSHLVLKRH